MNEEVARSKAQGSMLLTFGGRNVRSFRDEFEISLVATAMSEPSIVRSIPWRNGEARSSRVGVLPAAALFGANAAGKSNVLRALSGMRDAVLHSFRHWPDGRTRRVPFILDRAGAESPSSYRVEVILDGVLHEYGFELDDHTILHEWARRSPKGRSQLIYERTGSEVKVGSSFGSSLTAPAEAVRDNALLLSTAVAFRNSPLQPFYDWFARNLRLAEAANRDARQVYTARELKDPVRRDQILAMLRAADLGIVDIEEFDESQLDPSLLEKVEAILRVITDGEEPDEDAARDALATGLMGLVHKGSTGQVAMPLSEESYGSVVWLGLAGPVIDALKSGSVLLADELDASLHPALVSQLVRLFQDPETNPHRAQLLFTSHDVTLLGDSQRNRILGRDQIWLAEKANNGASRLLSLSDLGPRKEEAIGRRYLAGHYGGVPLVAAGDFAAVVDAGADH